jgi:hypothetical protein
VFEKLEDTLKRCSSRVVIVSDITGLFLDRDVPKRGGKEHLHENVYVSYARLTSSG